MNTALPQRSTRPAQPYSPFRQTIGQPAPLVQPGNGLLGQIDDQAGMDRLMAAFPGAELGALRSTYDAQKKQAMAKRQEALLPPQPQQPAGRQPAQRIQQPYSPF